MSKRSDLYNLSSGTRLSVYGSVFLRLLGFFAYVLMLYGFAVLMDATYQGVLNAYLEIFIALMTLGSIGVRYFCRRVSYRMLESQIEDVSVEVREEIAKRSNSDNFYQTKQVLKDLSVVEDNIRERENNIYIFFQSVIGCAILFFFDWHIACAYTIVLAVLEMIQIVFPRFKSFHGLLAGIGIMAGALVIYHHIQNGVIDLTVELLSAWLSFTLFAPFFHMKKRVDPAALSRIQLYYSSFSPIEHDKKENTNEIDIEVERKAMSRPSEKAIFTSFACILAECILPVLFMNMILDVLNYFQALPVSICFVLMGVSILAKCAMGWLFQEESLASQRFGLFLALVIFAIGITSFNALIGVTFLALGLMAIIGMPYFSGNNHMHSFFMEEEYRKEMNETILEQKISPENFKTEHMLWVFEKLNDGSRMAGSAVFTRDMVMFLVVAVAVILYGEGYANFFIVLVSFSTMLAFAPYYEKANGIHKSMYEISQTQKESMK